jgi:hypothetical protein
MSSVLVFDPRASSSSSQASFITWVLLIWMLMCWALSMLSSFYAYRNSGKPRAMTMTINPNTPEAHKDVPLVVLDEQLIIEKNSQTTTKSRST